MEEKITLYHVNDIEKVDYFFRENKLIVSKHKSDNSYVGKGMYFWNNRGNADYWANQKNNYYLNKFGKKKDLCLVVISSVYNSSELMDLTDSQQEFEYKKIIDSFSKAGKNIGQNLGEKIDYLCEKLNFKIVRFSSFYPKTPDSKLFKGSFVNNKNKIIYCIKPNHYDIIESKQREVF